MSLTVPPEWLAALADLVAERLADRYEPPKQWPEWMSVPTAARYLDCGEHRLRKLVQRKQIPHVREGGRVFFHRDDLNHWMTTKVENGPSPTASADVVS